MDTQIKCILKQLNGIHYRLSPILYHATLDFRKNLWQTFIQPLFEFILPLYHREKAMTRKEKIQTALRNTFKSFTSLKKTVKTELIEDLIGYNIDERSNELQQISLEKWTCRKEGIKYDRTERADIYEITRKVTDLTEKQKNKDEKKGRESQLSRKRIVEYAEKLIQPNVQKLKQFLNKAVNE